MLHYREDCHSGDATNKLPRQRRRLALAESFRKPGITMARSRILWIALLLALLALLALKPHRRPAMDAAQVDKGVEPAGLETQPIHAVRRRDAGFGEEYLVDNLTAGPIEVRCALEETDNVQSVPPLPRDMVLPALVEVKIAELRSIDPDRGGKAAIACSAIVGDPGASAPADVTYALPFPTGTAFTLDQGFDGAFSHHDEQSRYALDLAVAEGTPVLAARDGVVMQVEEDFRASGTDAERLGGRANYVRVVHADGSMAVYAHLAPKSMLRRAGDHVRVGELIGKSGNTGFSTGPHLHFSVQRNAGMSLQAIPFAMTGIDPRAARQ